ncbi:beclin 1-associated autophagy-related key regulator-like [Mercenaria mercenaria]|uniref:beclin 1-associated autophagy-related key regulator-like n=1 Tax=Mercenaria mercenaria TaxID=6596 RepID=UPI00234F44EC|nr:beclin 1-associated autophagy-related key regulator-like [Mercenaria mercenaria]
MEEISCSDNTAPLEFNLDTLIESKEGLQVAFERCPLCSESKRPFHCTKCVANGKFIHSNATYPDSYESLHRKWDRTKRERDHVLERFKKETAWLQRQDEKRATIDQCKRNIELLKLSLAATKDMKEKEKYAFERIRKENQMRYAKGKKHKEKKRLIVEYIEKVADTIEKKKEKLDARHGELMELRQKHINDLITYIFPVSEVKNKGDSMTMGASDDLREALHDASHMAYVRGRWIYSSSQYRIVEPALPSHGEYSQYNLMVARTREDGSTEACAPGNPGNSIIAGLCYTSQLVSVVAHILNVSLPKRQCYSDFCLQDLPEKQFNAAVARLNKNVLYLCFSQGVDTENIEPKHTLHNVLLLLRHQQLGRVGSFDVIQDMMDSVEDSNGQSEESDDDLPVSHDEPDSTEWERVPGPDSIPVPIQQEASSMQIGYMSQDMSDSTLTASGVISSAYNTVSSFFAFRR